MTTQSRQPRIPESHRGLLGSTALARAATAAPLGERQSNQVWLDWDGEHVWFSQIKTRQKHRNVHRDPRITLSIVAPKDPFRHLKIRGVVERIEEAPDLAFINPMAKNYLGANGYQNHRPGDERAVVLAKPQRTTKMGG